jgi:cell wall assembly regulator SMI1
MGRQLPEEVRNLYLWHDGCAIWMVPDLGFRGLKSSLQAFSMIQNLDLPELSNAEVTFERGSLFPVFDMDKPAFAVRTTRGSRERQSPLYLLDFEMSQLTMVARSVTAFIAHLVRELEASNFLVTEHGLTWRHDPLMVSRTMTPIG